MQNVWQLLKKDMTPALALALILEIPIVAYFFLLPFILILRSGSFTFGLMSLIFTSPTLLVLALLLRGVYLRDHFFLAIMIPVQSVVCFLYLAGLAHLLKDIPWLGGVAVGWAFALSLVVAVISVNEFRISRSP